MRHLEEQNWYIGHDLRYAERCGMVEGKSFMFSQHGASSEGIRDFRHCEKRIEDKRQEQGTAFDEEARRSIWSVVEEGARDKGLDEDNCLLDDDGCLIAPDDLRLAYNTSIDLSNKRNCKL